MKKNYITPKTQVKMLDTEMPIATSVPVNSGEKADDGNGGLAKKGVSIWE